MRSTSLLLLGAFAATVLVFGQVGCSGTTTDTFGTPPPTPTPSGPPTFSGSVYPQFTSLSCVGCHAATSPMGGLSLAGATASAVYASLTNGGAKQTGGVKDVDTATPANSLILCEVLMGGCDAGHSVHPFTTTSDAGYSTIRSWIQAGAPNN